MNTYRHTLCPLCGSNKITHTGEIKYTQPIVFSTLEITLENSPELWNCRVCESYFTQNIIPKDKAEKLYSEGESSTRWGRNEPFQKSKSKEIIDCLSKLFQINKRVLDIGCNTGSLLDFAKSSGCITSGVELSSQSKAILERKGHHVFENKDDVTGKYDVITAFDLIEHIYNVPEFLQSCTQLLSDNGVLVVLTGNIHSYCAKLCMADWWYIKYPEHIMFPSKKLFSQQIGLKLVDVVDTYASLAYDRPNIIGFIKSLLKLIAKYPYNGLPSIGGDHMLLVLKKD